MAYSTSDIRNIALVGQAGAGKTLLAEALLLEAGATRSRGSLERGTTVCDFDPQEKQLRHSLDAALVRIDLTGVSFIDSAALGWLVLAQRRFQRIGGKMCIIAPTGFVRDILELTEIGEWIPIFASEDDAVRALKLSPSSSAPSESE